MSKPEPISPTVGRGVLHLFCKPTPLADGEAVVAAVKTAQGAGVQVVTVSVLGHKCDAAFMAMHEDWRELRRLQTGLQQAGLEVVDRELVVVLPTADANWYTLPFEERKELMHEHGVSGRKFAGRIVQYITASTGLDDYEWGVTLFGVHPDDLKDVVYTMRFDHASAVYAEFGPFYTGMVVSVEELAGLL